MKVKVMALLIGLVMLGGTIWYANREPLASEGAFGDIVFSPAEITELLEDNTWYHDEDPDYLVGSRLFEVRLSSGAYLEARTHISPLMHRHFAVGDRVIVRYDDFSVEITNLDRSRTMVGLMVLFLGVLIVLGGKAGLKTVTSLLFTMVSIIFILNPLLLRGFAAIPTTVGILSFVTVIVLILISGWSRKTAVSVAACLIGVLSAALAAYVAGELAAINGLNMENIGTLIQASDLNGIALDASGLFISGVLIASLGAVMDTAVSIASSVSELKLANPSLTQGQLFKAAYSIGKDVMGTMANTLILAFAGAGINLLLTLSAWQISFHQMISNDFLGIEIIRSLAGSLGIALTVPAAAFIGSWLYSRGPQPKNN